nr:LysE family translocator [uncultured Roseateles sp.]
MEASNSLWIYFALTLGVIALPGMDMAFVAGSALTAGVRGGLLAVAGIVVGGIIHVLVNVSGVSALLMLWPGAFNALLLGGSAYMAWIGWGILASTLKPAVAGSASVPQRPQGPASAIFLRGVLNCLLNPKAYAFMLAVFPAFLRTPGRGLAEQAVLLSAITAGNQIAVYGAIAVAAAGAQRWAGPGRDARRWISAAVGATLIAAAVFTLAGAWQPASAQTTEGPTMTSPSTPVADASHDFDFLIGKWDISNRRLLKQLQGSNEWETFKATNHAHLLPGGIGNYDEFVPVGWRPGFVGMSLRVFNPQTQAWSIFWLTNRDGGIDARTHGLQPPVVGRFEGDTGLFYGEEVMDGRLTGVRFEWTRLGPNAARWQQAFSVDGGKSWEVNWVMDLTRQRAVQ